jgi:hypothetical protein
MTHKRLFILSLITLISIFMAYQVYALRMPEPTFVAASTDEYRWGTTDTNIAQMKSDIREIKSKIDGICAEVTKVQVQAARDGGLYGGGAGIGVYLLGLLVQALKKKGGVK